LRNALSSDDLAVGDMASAELMLSLCKRKEDGVPGRFVWEELVKREDE